MQSLILFHVGKGNMEDLQNPNIRKLCYEKKKKFFFLAGFTMETADPLSSTDKYFPHTWDNMIYGT